MASRQRWIGATLQPFEAAFGAIVMAQGVVALLGGSVVDPAATLLPGWLVIAFQASYAAAGLAILIGLVLPRSDVEGAGLILLGATLLSRAILFGQLLGWGLRSVSSLAFSAFLVCACVMRLMVVISDRPRRVVTYTPPDDDTGDGGE